jgi:hypothetical protein
MRTVWKFPIPVQDGIFELLMPEDAQLLHVGMGDLLDEVWLWAQVETDAKKERRRFIIHGTNHAIVPLAGETQDYVGTAYDYGQPLVWHLFEVKT